MANKKSRLVKQLPKIAISVPDSRLIRLTDSPDLRNRFDSLRQDAIGLTKCLSHRFGRGGDNPIQVALKNNWIDAFEAELAQTHLDIYVAKWDVIQHSWIPYLEKDFECIGISNDVQLFSETIREYYNSAYVASQKGYECIHSQYENIHKIFRDLIWDDTGKIFNSPEFEEACRIAKKQLLIDFSTWTHIHRTVVPHRLKDRKLKRLINDLVELSGIIHDLNNQQLRRERKQNEAQSIKWELGNFFIGTKGGGWDKTVYTS